MPPYETCGTPEPSRRPVALDARIEQPVSNSGGGIPYKDLPPIQPPAEIVYCEFCMEAEARWEADHNPDLVACAPCADEQTESYDWDWYTIGFHDWLYENRDSLDHDGYTDAINDNWRYYNEPDDDDDERYIVNRYNEMGWEWDDDDYYYYGRVDNRPEPESAKPKVAAIDLMQLHDESRST